MPDNSADINEVAGHLKKVKQKDGEAAAVEAALEASVALMKSSQLRMATAKWFEARSGTDAGIDSDPKFGDGIANAASANKPMEIVKVGFYDGTYKAYGEKLDKAGQDKLFENIASWSLPMGRLWDAETMYDLRKNSDLVLERHSGGQPAEVVVPLYLYSASQKGTRYVWGVWVMPPACSPPRWKVVSNPSLEKAYHASGGKSVPIDRSMFHKSWFPEICGSLPKEVQLQTIATDAAPDGMEGAYKIVGGCSVMRSFFSKRYFGIFRYEIAVRGDPKWSPLHDTVFWLPPPSVTDTFGFDPPLRVLPPSGIIEYLYSRPAAETFTWTAEHGWTCEYALGKAAKLLIDKCFAEPNQQEYNQELHQDFLELVNVFTGEDVSDRLVKVIASLAQGSSAVAPRSPTSPPTSPGLLGKEESQPFFDAMDVFASAQAARRHLIECGFTGTLLKELFHTKLGGKPQPPPGLLAHVLEVQLLTWQGQHHLLALSGGLACCTTTDGRVATLSRGTNSHDDQIFWQMNRAMRMKQFKVKPHLQVNRECEGFAGNYYEVTPQENLFRRDDPPQHTAKWEGGKWVVTPADGSSAVALSNVWFESGTWLLEQIQPLVFYIDRALEKAALIPDSKAPPGLRTYRGLKDVALPRQIYDDQKVVLWGAYSSTSGDRGIATSFAGGEGKAAVFSLVGVNPVCIAQWSRYGREREWLYPANSEFQVTSSLSQEQQEILGKKNLQIFSMCEVNELNAALIYLRSLVNSVVSYEEETRMPRHVRQLFGVMQAIEEGRLDRALYVTCDPDELVLETKEGQSIAHMLNRLDYESTRHIFVDIARNRAGPNPFHLNNLVRAGSIVGLTDADAVTWLTCFEEWNRKFDIDGVWEITAQEAHQRCLIVLEEMKECLPLVVMMQKQELYGVEAVQVKGLRGERMHFNGVYVRDDSEAGIIFRQEYSIRLLSNPSIRFDELTRLWRLEDEPMRAPVEERPAGWERWVPVSQTLLTRYGCSWGHDPDYSSVQVREDYGFPVVTNTVAVKPTPEVREEAWDFDTVENMKKTKELLKLPPSEVTARLNGRKDSCASENNEVDAKGVELVKALFKRMGKQRKVVTYPPGTYMNQQPAPKPYEEVSREELEPFEIGTGFGWEPHESDPYTGGEGEAAMQPEEEPPIPELPKKTEEQIKRTEEYLKKTKERSVAYYCRGGSVSERFKMDTKARPYRFENKLCTRGKKLSDIRESKGEDGFREYLYKYDSGRSEEIFQFFVTRWQDACRKREQELPKLLKDTKACEKIEKKVAESVKRWEEEAKNFEKAMANYKEPPRTRVAGAKRYENNVKTGFTQWGLFDEGICRSTGDEAASRGFITIGVGQAGCQIASSLLGMYVKEHGMHEKDEDVPDGMKYGRSRVFAEKADGTWNARFLFVDSDPDPPLRVMKTHPKFASTPNILYSNGDSAMYARAMYEKKGSLKEAQMEKLRHLVEELDVLDGMQFLTGIGGGAGSGLFGQLADGVAKYYGKVPVFCHAITVSPKVASPVAPYNSLLALGQIDRSDFVTVLYDNETMYRIFDERLGQPRPLYDDLNSLVAKHMVNLDSPMRFHNSLNCSFEARRASLVVQKELRYVVPSFAPFTCSAVNVTALTKAALHPVGTLLPVNLMADDAVTFGSMLAYRGEVSQGLTHHARKACQTNMKYHYNFWKTSFVEQKPTTVQCLGEHPLEVSGLTNSSAVTTHLKDLAGCFDKLYAKRAFVHFHVAAGGEEGEMLEARELVQFLTEAYTKEAAKTGEPPEDEYEEEE